MMDNSSLSDSGSTTAADTGTGAAFDVTSVQFWYCLCGALACLIISGLASGVNIGLMSLSPLSLKLLVDAAPAEIRRDPLLRLQARRAMKVLPLVSRKHVVLVTLLLTTAIADEVLPLCIDAIAPTWVAVVVSVATMLLFTEVIPTAIFTDHRNSLKLAAGLAPFVWSLIGLLGVITYPMAKAVELFVEKTHKKVGDADSAAGSCDDHEQHQGGSREGSGGEGGDSSVAEARQLLKVPRFRALLKVLKKESSRVHKSHPTHTATDVATSTSNAVQPGRSADSVLSYLQLTWMDRALELRGVTMLDVMEPIASRTLRMHEFSTVTAEPGAWQSMLYRVLCRKNWQWFVVEGLRGAGSWDAFDAAVVVACVAHAASPVDALLEALPSSAGRAHHHAASSLIVVDGSETLLDVEARRSNMTPQDGVVLVRGRVAGCDDHVVIGACHVPQALRDLLVPHENHQEHNRTQHKERDAAASRHARKVNTSVAATGAGFASHRVEHGDSESEDEDIAALLNVPRVANAVPWSMKYASANW